MKTIFGKLNSDFALDTVAPKGRIGVVALATDFTIEQDMRKMLPPGVQMFTNRVQNKNPMSVKNLRAMGGDIGRAAAGLLPGLGVNVVVYACTSGAAVIGYEAIKKRVQRHHPTAPLTTPLTAAAAAFQKLGAKKISILTPYIDEINKKLAGYYRGENLQVLNVDGFGFRNDIAVAGIPPQKIIAAAKKVCDQNADALFISCTALRAAQVVDKIEQKIGKPVVASNQAIAWHCLRLLNVRPTRQGFGKLLAANK